MSKTRMIRWITATVFSVLLCGPTYAADLKIGLLLSQTGPLSAYGVPMKSAAEYAAKVINAAGGIDGHKLVLVTEDDASNPVTFLNGLNRLLERENVLALVGPITSGFFQAAAPIIEDTGVVMISPTATAPNLTARNPFAFRNNPSEDVNIPRLLAYMKKAYPGVQTVSIIYDNREAADKVIGGLYEKLSPDIGWRVQAVTTFLSGQLDFSDVVTKALRNKPDIVAVAAHAADAANAARELRRQGYKGVILGGTSTVSQDYIKIGKAAADSTYVVVPYYEGVKTEQNMKFVDGYTQYTGRKTVDPWEASTYESIGLLAQAMRSARATGNTSAIKEERARVQSALASISGFPGLVGKISFGPDRVVRKPALIIRVENGKWEAVQALEASANP